MLRDSDGCQQNQQLGEAVEEMQRELEIMKSLNHENVVKIKGILHVSIDEECLFSLSL